MINIIGAGPIGSYLGYRLSEKGIPNTIIEEHNRIGLPEQCTGLISTNIDSIIPGSWTRKAVQNKVRGAVISCRKQSFEIAAKSTKAYVFDRSLFDQAIAEKAKNKGSELVLGHRYVNHKPEGKGLKIRLENDSKQSYLGCSVLVGADGPNSLVARNSGLYGERRFWAGTQAVVRTKKPWFDKDRVYVFLDSRYSDGFFAWVVPIDESRAKAGLGTLSRPAERMQRFLNDKFDDFVVEQRHAGLIPVYDRIKLQNRERNVFLVGDAALQAKAISGGGVVNGMLAAKELSNAISDGDMDYEKRLGHVRRNLWLHLKLRNRLNSMSDEKKEELLKELSHEKVKKVLREKGDMDFPKRFLFKLLLSRPGLARFML